VTFSIEHVRIFAFATSWLSLGRDDRSNRLIDAEIHSNGFNDGSYLVLIFEIQKGQ
jgi:hypothetical protein